MARLSKILPVLALSSLAVYATEYVLEAVGKARAAPDQIHLLVKMEQDSARLSDAAISGENQLRDFLAAVDDLKIPGLTYRVVNNVITPGAYGPGVTYTRNVVFTFEADKNIDRDGIIARLEDLGARCDSHCVTCIGSG